MQKIVITDESTTPPVLELPEAIVVEVNGRRPDDIPACVGEQLDDCVTPCGGDSRYLQWTKDDELKCYVVYRNGGVQALADKWQRWKRVLIAQSERIALGASVVSHPDPNSLRWYQRLAKYFALRLRKESDTAIWEYELKDGNDPEHPAS